MTGLTSRDRDRVKKKPKIFTTKLFMGKVCRPQSKTLGQRNTPDTLYLCFTKCWNQPPVTEAANWGASTRGVRLHPGRLPGRCLRAAIIHPRLLSSRCGHVKSSANDMWVKIVYISRREFARSRSSFSYAFYPEGSSRWQSHGTRRARVPAPRSEVQTCPPETPVLHFNLSKK